MSGDGLSLAEAEKLAKQLELNLISALAKPFRLADIEDVLAGTWSLPLQPYAASSAGFDSNVVAKLPELVKSR